MHRWQLADSGTTVAVHWRQSVAVDAAPAVPANQKNVNVDDGNCHFKCRFSHGICCPNDSGLPVDSKGQSFDWSGAVAASGAAVPAVGAVGAAVVAAQRTSGCFAVALVRRGAVAGRTRAC